MLTVSHIGICVADLDRSLRFYCQGLDFEVSQRHEIGAPFGPALEAPGDIAVVSQFIQRPDLRVELLGWSVPQPSGAPSTSRAQLGITHLSFHVDDVDARLQTLLSLGATLLPETRLTLGPLDLVFVADPDGTRIELLKTA